MARGARSLPDWGGSPKLTHERTTVKSGQTARFQYTFPTPSRGVFMTRGKLAVVLLGGLLSAAPAAAQAATKTDPAVQELLRLEDSWTAALVKRDRATFERLLAPRFVYSEDDKTFARDAVMRDLVS